MKLRRAARFNFGCIFYTHSSFFFGSDFYAVVVKMNEFGGSWGVAEHMCNMPRWAWFREGALFVIAIQIKEFRRKKATQEKREHFFWVQNLISRR